MSTVHELALPLTEDQVRKLRVGDLVYLSGDIIMTAGMPTHQRMLDFIERQEPLPLDLNGQVLLQFGGYQREVDGKMEVVYINPTTSTRFNPYMPSLIRGCQLRAVGGKGGLDAASARAMQEVGCVYLSFPGGGCTLYSNAIREVVAVEWRDLFCITGSRSCASIAWAPARSPSMPMAIVSMTVFNPRPRSACPTFWRSSRSPARTPPYDIALVASIAVRPKSDDCRA
jgi:fumarate hydratase subunit beta